MRLGVVGSQCDSAVVALERIFEAIELLEGVALVVERVGVVGLDRNGALEIVKRLRAASECNKDAAAIVERLGKAPLVLERLLEARQRFLVAVHGVEYEAEVQKNLRRLRPQLHRR